MNRQGPGKIVAVHVDFDRNVVAPIIRETLG